jgi:anti-sigma-K factor RskA
MSVHEQFAEDLALYALGSLEGDERMLLEKHLEECASCRRELEQLRGDAALLALSATGPRPPERAQARLMDSIAKEPRGQYSPTGVGGRGARRWAVWGWAAAAAMMAVVAGVWNENAKLKSSLADLQGLSEQQRFALAQARHVVDTLTAQDVQRVDVMLVGGKRPPPPPQGKAIYSRQNNGLIFVASNLLPLPAEKAYELWIIPAKGAPIPAGVFKPDAHGGAMVINPPIPAGVEAKAFAITIEPEHGSTTPTMPIVMIGG